MVFGVLIHRYACHLSIFNAISLLVFGEQLYEISTFGNNILLHVFQAIKEAGIDLDGFLTVGVSAALRQLLEFGLFHGDPHPGNIFAMHDGRVAYVDFGNVAVLSQVKICTSKIVSINMMLKVDKGSIYDLCCIMI